MGLLANLKPFAPLLLTFVIPRAINYYRVLKTSIRTQPLPKALGEDTRRGLAIVFTSICYFFCCTLPFWWPTEENVFAITNSRLQIPTDVLFGTRLAMVRPRGQLTRFDESLRSKLTTSASRQLYLRFGPATLVNCSFCHPEDDLSYLLYYLPTNVILPHLIHVFLLGLSTSEALAGFEARQWRKVLSTCAVGLAAVDVYTTASYAPHIDPNMPAPLGAYWQARTLRPLAVCLFDFCAALLIWATATNRLIIFSSSASQDPTQLKRQRDQMLGQANIALQSVQMKLRGYTIARHAIVRQPALKTADDEYWRAVVAMEGPAGVDGVWNDEEVQAAISRALGSGSIDVSRMERDAQHLVSSITAGLEST